MAITKSVWHPEPLRPNHHSLEYAGHRAQVKYVGPHSFSNYSQGIYYMPSTILGSQVTSVKKTDRDFYPCEVYI